jgi:hypothetical protein
VRTLSLHNQNLDVGCKPLRVGLRQMPVKGGAIDPPRMNGELVVILRRLKCVVFEASGLMPGRILHIDDSLAHGACMSRSCVESRK